MNDGFTVVMAGDYYSQLVARIALAKHRITLAAMVVQSGPMADKILVALGDAAKRGVSVNVLADVFTFSYFGRSGVSGAVFRQRRQATRQILAKLQAVGCRVTWVGKMGLNPYKGRYHAKITIIDDDVFSFGGVNFIDNAWQNIDYMLHTKDTHVANLLQRLVTDTAQNTPATDFSTRLSPQHTLLYDAGRQNHSIIYDHACALAAKAKSVAYVSQFCPSGKLAKILRQTNSTCYYNRPGQTGFTPQTLAQLWDVWRTGIPNHYTGSAFIHAKVMLFELGDGTKAVISGSHNFSWRGVAFGTKEIALLSTDAALWRQLQDIVYKVAVPARTR